MKQDNIFFMAKIFVGHKKDTCTMASDKFMLGLIIVKLENFKIGKF